MIERIDKMRRSFTLVEIMIVVAIVALLAALAIPNFLRTRITANESAAQASLRTISTAMENYRAANGSYIDATLNSLSTADPPYIDSVLGSGTKQGYSFTLSVEANNQSYVATCVPVTANITGARSFCVTDDGVIRGQITGGTIADRAACRALSATQ